MSTTTKHNGPFLGHTRAEWEELLNETSRLNEPRYSFRNSARTTPRASETEPSGESVVAAIVANIESLNKAKSTAAPVNPVAVAIREKAESARAFLAEKRGPSAPTITRGAFEELSVQDKADFIRFGGKLTD